MTTISTDNGNSHWQYRSHFIGDLWTSFVTSSNALCLLLVAHLVFPFHLMFERSADSNAQKKCCAVYLMKETFFFSVRSNLSKPTSAINLITFQSQLHRLMFASMLWKCREIKVWQTIYISRDLNNVWLVISATGFFFFSLANLRSPDARSYLACIFIKQKLITK